MPTNPTNINPIAALPEDPLIASTKLIKNKIQPTTNNPVLTSGTKQDAIMHPTNGYLFLNGKNTNPAVKPARDVFKITTITVAQALTAIKAPTSPTSKLSTPSTNPKKKPPKGPNKHAPTAIGTNVKLSVKLPILITFDNPNRQTSIAVRIPRPVIVLVVKYFFISSEL